MVEITGNYSFLILCLFEIGTSEQILLVYVRDHTSLPITDIFQTLIMQKPNKINFFSSLLQKMTYTLKDEIRTIGLQDKTSHISTDLRLGHSLRDLCSQVHNPC